MPTDLLIAEFQTLRGEAVRLYRVLDDTYSWFDYENLALGGDKGNIKSGITLFRKRIRDALRDRHLMASFILKARGDGCWQPVSGFAILNDTGADLHEVKGNRITNVMWTQHMYGGRQPGSDSDFIESVIFWVLFELCQLDTDEDIFSRVLFELEVPSPTDDAKLEAWRTSKEYRELRNHIVDWRDNPPDHGREAPAIRAMAEVGEVVLGAMPSSAVRYDDWVVTPIEENTMYPESIEFAVTFEETDQYIACLSLFDGEEKPTAPTWEFVTEGRGSIPFRHPSAGRTRAGSRDYGEDESDLYTCLRNARLVIPASQYEAWMDAHTAHPTKVFAHLDLEPYLLLGTRVPWLWPDVEANPFFKERAAQRLENGSDSSSDWAWVMR